MTRTEVIEVMGLVAATWTNWKLPQARNEEDRPRATQEMKVLVNAWHRVLGTFDAAAVVAAVDSFVVEGGAFAPHQGMIAKRAAELIERGEGRSLPDVDEAWAEVQAELARVGWTGALDPDRKPRFSHPAIADAVDAMGWQYLCESQDAMADRAHFLKLYGAATARVRRDAVVPESVAALLAGLAERDAQTLGEGVSQVAVLSDKRKGAT